MRNLWMRRLALYLAVLLVLPAVLGILPEGIQAAEAGQYDALYQEAKGSSGTEDPLSTWSSNHFVPAKFAVSASKNMATVTLKKAVTAKQVKYLNEHYSYMAERMGYKKGKNKAVFWSYMTTIRNLSKNELYYTVGTVKTGSKKMTLVMYKYNTNTYKYQKVKIKKGKKFQLCANKKYWGLAMTAKSK